MSPCRRRRTYHRRVRVLVLAFVFLGACAPRDVRPTPAVKPEEAYAAQEQVEPYVPWAERARAFHTRLSVYGPSESRVAEPPPAGATAVTYPSEVGPLRAWVVRAARATEAEKPPVVVVFHNGFSLRPDALPPVAPLAEAGFTLLFPSWRGEDGNPGHLELLAGELRDAKAAIAFARTLPDVEARCIYVIGHSIGGGLATLLSLERDMPVRLVANVGGIYRAHTFHDWKASPNNGHLVRFDVDDPREITMRLLVPNMRDLAIPHVSYTGRDDAFDIRYARWAQSHASVAPVPYETVEVPGDHMTSMAPAVADFRARILADAKRCYAGDSREVTRP